MPLVIVSLIRCDGLIRFKTTVLKTLTTLLTLGLGASLGREGPVVLLGGSVGSAFGRLVRLPHDWVRSGAPWAWSGPRPWAAATT